MKDFLAFRTMLTPVIIQVIFWLGAAICVIVGLVLVLSGVGQYGGGPNVLKGFLLVFLGPVGVRIYCEILIIFFRINETLTEIKHALEDRRSSQQGKLF
ncbi:MAG: DUF4282 domain-containing protein [Desulfobaccales bacterium]